jgi:hypothetical protein
MGNAQFLNDFPLFGGLRATAPMIIGQYAVEQTHAAASTIDVTGGGIVVPKGYFGPGSTFRFTVYGSRTGTAGAATLLVDINGTTAVTLAVPTNTAVDFFWQATVHEAGDFAHQQNSAFCLTSATVLSAFDYNASTVNVSEKSTIKLKQTLASSSDTLVIDYILIEYWKL